MSNEPILECQDLEKTFESGSLIDSLLNRTQRINAVDGVSFSLRTNESRGIIGESGCGKTTLIKTLIGLHQKTGGDIRLDGRSISTFDKADWKEYRRRVQMIFQDPFNSLNPRMTVRDSLKEPLKVHNQADQDDRVYKALETVELSPPQQYLDRDTTQLSGGEKQRVSIARALILEPDVILADEPVSMLDVSTQASILKLLSRLVNERDVSLLYISHDLSTVSYVCDSIDVMYLGRIVEEAPTEELINDPKHPYTQELIKAVPLPDPHANRARTEMEGSPRTPINISEGCRFRDRCPERMEICERTPKFVPVDGDGKIGQRVACHLYYEHGAQ